MNAHGQPDPGINAVQRIKRDLAEMLGLAKGVLADGNVTEEEAFMLMNWADDHPDIVQGWWPSEKIWRRRR